MALRALAAGGIENEWEDGVPIMAVLFERLLDRLNSFGNFGHLDYGKF